MYEDGDNEYISKNFYASSLNESLNKIKTTEKITGHLNVITDDFYFHLRIMLPIVYTLYNQIFLRFLQSSVKHYKLYHRADTSPFGFLMFPNITTNKDRI